MEKASCSGRAFSKCLVTDVLPAPDGAAMMMSLLLNGAMKMKGDKSKDLSGANLSAVRQGKEKKK